MAKLPKIQSDFALLDVKRGRKALARHLAKHGPQEVVVKMTLRRVWGNDDGTSIEFQADVTDVRPTQPAPSEET